MVLFLVFFFFYIFAISAFRFERMIWEYLLNHLFHIVNTQSEIAVEPFDWCDKMARVGKS